MIRLLIQRPNLYLLAIIFRSYSKEIGRFFSFETGFFSRKKIIARDSRHKAQNCPTNVLLHTCLLLNLERNKTDGDLRLFLNEHTQDIDWPGRIKSRPC